jgi:hypothetical protein
MPRFRKCLSCVNYMNNDFACGLCAQDTSLTKVARTIPGFRDMAEDLVTRRYKNNDDIYDSNDDFNVGCRDRRRSS